MESAATYAPPLSALPRGPAIPIIAAAKDLLISCRRIARVSFGSSGRPAPVLAILLEPSGPGVDVGSMVASLRSIVCSFDPIAWIEPASTLGVSLLAVRYLSSSCVFLSRNSSSRACILASRANAFDSCPAKDRWVGGCWQLQRAGSSLMVGIAAPSSIRNSFAIRSPI